MWHWSETTIIEHGRQPVFVVPGIVIMSIGGLIGLAASRIGPLSLVAGLMFGIGGALVLDEFPLIRACSPSSGSSR